MAAVSSRTSPDCDGGGRAITSPAPPHRSVARQGTGPQYRRYVLLAARVESFSEGSEWPEDKEQTPEDLAEAGFFFAGILDCTRCYYCGLGTKNWQPGDIPLEVHFRFSENCGYLKERFHWRLGQYEKRPSAIPRNVRDNSFVVDSVLARPCGVALEQTGYPRHLIVAAITKVLNEIGWDDSKVTSALLLHAVFDIQAKEKDSASSDSRSGQEDVEDDDDRPPSTTVSPTNSIEEEMESMTLSVMENEKKRKRELEISKITAMQEENRRLKAALTCKICLDEQVSVVYLPCGHLVTCINCYKTQRKCPICRSDIRAYVKTYL